MRPILYYKDLYVAITIVILGEPPPENSAYKVVTAKSVFPNPMRLLRTEERKPPGTLECSLDTPFIIIFLIIILNSINSLSF